MTSDKLRVTNDKKESPFPIGEGLFIFAGDYPPDPRRGDKWLVVNFSKGVLW